MKENYLILLLSFGSTSIVAPYNELSFVKSTIDAIRKYLYGVPLIPFRKLVVVDASGCQLMRSLDP